MSTLLTVLAAAGFAPATHIALHMQHQGRAAALAAAPRMEAVIGSQLKPWWRRGKEEEISTGAKLACVGDYMTGKEKLLTLTPDMSLQDAACTLCGNGISGAPVVGDPCPHTGEPKLIGILSQQDLLHKAAGKFHVPFVTSGARSERYTINTQRLRKALGGEVADAMSTHPVTITPDVTMQKAAAMLLRKKINRLPVVDEEGGLIGMISTTDIMRAVTTDPAGCAILDN